jgi:hypothetical protein
MSVVDDLVTAYRHRVNLPLRTDLSPAERVWIAVYTPDQERRLRHRLDELAIVTSEAGLAWRTADVTDSFGTWLAAHEYRESYFRRPERLTSAALESFADEVVRQVDAELIEADDRTVVALVGTGALYPFVRASRVIEGVEASIRGRLLVLFPGRVDGTSFRLLDARDGWNYRATPITATKDGS